MGKCYTNLITFTLEGPMKLFLFGELNKANILKLCPNIQILCDYTLYGYNVYCTLAGRSFIKKCGSTDNGIIGFIVECTENDLWVLDQWKDVLLLHRVIVSEKDDIDSYTCIYDIKVLSKVQYTSEFELINFVETRNLHTSLKFADVHLLIPGFCEYRPEDVENSKIGRTLQDAIQKVNSSEFNNDFLKDCQRYALGLIFVKMRNGSYQQAVLTLMRHADTKLCVLDIFVPAILESTHYLLDSYCGEFIEFKYNNEILSINELCNTLGIQLCGSKRSMVFVYEKVDEERLLNILVNEDKPMGKIMGTHFKNILKHNLAQYDTAEVYASEVTMVELTDKIESDLLTRIQSQAIEIFFVEMLLLEDAAVSKMYEKVQNEINEEHKNPFRKNTGEIISELIDEATFAVSFTDYHQFYYPTVRISAAKVAKAFGIDDIREKYNLNKNLLEQMIKDHNALIARKDNAIKNSLLIIITLLSGVATIFEAFNLITSSAYESISYYVAIGIMAFGVLLYFCIRKIVRAHDIKKFRKKYEDKIKELNEDNRK